MEPITFPDFMNEENMRKMSREELVNLFLMMGQAMLPSGGAEMPDPLTLPIAGERMMVPTARSASPLRYTSICTAAALWAATARMWTYGATWPGKSWISM